MPVFFMILIISSSKRLQRLVKTIFVYILYTLYICKNLNCYEKIN